MWPRYNVSEIWRQINARGTAQKQGSTVLLGGPILKSLRDTDLGPQAFSPGVPLLVCHGTGDSRISHLHSRELAGRVTPGPHFRYTEFEGASHSFRPPELHWQNLSLTVINWLTRGRR